MRTRILGLSGSPRTSSNTAILVETALDAAEKAGAVIEFLDLSALDIRMCEHCSECSQTERCKLNDDLNKVADKMRVADGIIFGSPDHHASVAAPLKNVMDRTGRFMKLEGKVGASIVVGRRSGTDITMTQMLFFMLVKEMIVPGGVHWPIGFALNAGDIRADTEAIAMAKQMGTRITQLATNLVRNPVPWAHEPRPTGQKVRFGHEWQ
ncbi:MAG: flavodoxin family protein [Candidatus Thorarchaeota archaeon]